MSDSSPAPSVRRFVDQYRRLRVVEGFADDNPSFVRALPFRDLTGRNRLNWRFRALNYLVVHAALAAVPGVRRVLDVGAGNGWLARRLARSFEVTALDVDDTNTGLRALDDTRVRRLRAEIEALPVRNGAADAVVVAAALHYAVDLRRALGELARVLRGGGVLIVADSPIYPNAAACAAAHDRTRAYFASAGVPELAARYHGLTRHELDAAGTFRFRALTPGITSLRAALESMLGPGHPSPRLPVLLGRRL